MKFFTDVKYLWLEQVLELRATWHWYAAYSLFFPLMMVFGFSRIGAAENDQAALIRIITGAAMFAIANDGLTATAVRVSTMRSDGMLLYYASLPISKIAFVTALMLARFTIALPGMLAPLVIGPLVFGIDAHYDVTLIFLIPLIGLMLTSLGMVFGFLVTNVEIAHVVTNVLLFILVLAAPVFIAWESLPVPFQVIALFMPFTYAADALQQVLAGTRTAAFWLDVGLLTALTAAFLFILERRFRWRVN